MVAYQIYPRSFADSNGDGIGDLPGITAHLDYLVWLGVDALWLSPFYRSPMADFGYDIADHCDVDPLFGTLADIDRLVAEAHQRRLRVLVDWVPNHTSDTHPWFLAARSSPDDPHRDWYVWRNPAPDGGPPNNWIASWGGGPAWTLDPASGQYYLHCFLPSQPDLNWAHPGVVAAQHEVLRFWLDRGVDGFRADVVHLIGKDPALADDPAEVAGLPHVVLNDRPETHPLLRDLRHLLDAYPHEPAMVGEVFLFDTDAMAAYLGDGDELHLAFNFPPLFSRWSAPSWRRHIERTEAAVGVRSGWPTWALSNHDVPRTATRLAPTAPAPTATLPTATLPTGAIPSPAVAANGDAVARAAAVLLLTLRGTPFLYAGEELGLPDSDVAPEAALDPGGRDGCRGPIPWSTAPPHGWEGAAPPLPFCTDAGGRSVDAQREDPTSTLHLYRRLLATRRRRPSLRCGTLTLLATPEGVVGWRRHDPDDPDGAVITLVNFTDGPVPLDPSLHLGSLLISSTANHSSRPPATLGPLEAVLCAEATAAAGGLA